MKFFGFAPAEVLKQEYGLNSVIKQIAGSFDSPFVVPVIIIFTFLCIEGIASFLTLFFGATLKRRFLAERLHTKYDPELGWANIPSMFIKDMYGDRRHVTLNSAGFRARRDYSYALPAEKFRIICSGDSFTFGYGVDDTGSWPEFLTQVDARLETVNMGMGGYGIDQAFLWYMRDGTRLESDLHLFQVNFTDFRRMQSDNFLGCPKPIIRLDGTIFSVENVPVPKKKTFFTFWQIVRDVFSGSRIVELIKLLDGILPGIRSIEANGASSTLFQENTRETLAVRETALKIFEKLKTYHLKGNTLLLIVFTPMAEDISHAGSLELREYLAKELKRRGIHFIDLVKDFRALPVNEVEGFFIKNPIKDFFGSAGHYTEKGNYCLAIMLYKRLLEIPEIEKGLIDKTSSKNFGQA